MSDLMTDLMNESVSDMQAEIERLQKSSNHWKAMHDSALDSAKAEASRADVLKKDADRYRWLRENQFDALDIMESSGADQMQYKTSDELDAAIDDAITGESQS